MNKDLENRLYNWKFNSAIRYLDDSVSEKDKEIIVALREMFGNSGWFDGTLGLLVNRVVNGLIGENKFLH